MTLLLGECKKLYTRRYIAIIALIVFLNGFLIIQGKYSEGIEKTAVAQVYEDMADMSLTEAHIWLDTRCELLRIDFMQEALPLEQLRDIISEESLQIYAEQGCTLHYCTDSSAEYNLLHYVQEQIIEAEQYPQYLENMQQSAKRMTSSSLFGNVSSFSNRNIAKTAKKYAGLRSQLAINNGVGIEELMASGWTDCLMVLLLTSGALLLILSDRENNMQILLQTTQCGRTAIFRAKYVVLILHTLLMTCLLIGSKAILVQLLYGFGDLSLPIQSIPAYLQSVLPCSVGKVLFAWLLAKTAVYWVFASIAFCFSTCLRKSVWALLCLALFWGASYTAIQLLDPYGTFSLLVNVNPIHILRTELLLQTYRNTNLAGYPVSSVLLCATAAVIAWVLSFQLSARCFHHPERVKQTIKRRARKPKLRVSTNLFRQELYVLYISSGAVALIVIFLGIQAAFYPSIEFPITREDLYFKEYMTVLSGEWTQDKEDFLLTEREKIRNADAKLTELSSLVQQGELTELEASLRGIPYQKQKEWESALERAEVQLTDVKRGKATFLYDSGYEYLLGNQGIARGVQHMAICAFVLLLCIVPYKCREYESGLVSLVRTTAHGRKRRTDTQLCSCLTLALPCTVLAWLPGIIAIETQFGFNGLSAPVQSLGYLAEFPLTCSIIQFCALALLGVLFCACLTVLVCYAVSAWIKKTIPALLISGAAVVLPVLVGNMLPVR